MGQKTGGRFGTPLRAASYAWRSGQADGRESANSRQKFSPIGPLNLDAVQGISVSAKALCFRSINPAPQESHHVQARLQSAFTPLAAILPATPANPLHSGTFREMRKVKPMRQTAMAELMVAANDFSASYAQCLLAATP